MDYDGEYDDLCTLSGNDELDELLNHLSEADTINSDYNLFTPYDDDSNNTNNNNMYDMKDKLKNDEYLSMRENCYQCGKELTLKELFYYDMRDYICLKCSIAVDSKELSDWEKRHRTMSSKSKLFKECKHCHNLKNKCRYFTKTGKISRTCDYCRLRSKLNRIKREHGKVK